MKYLDKQIRWVRPLFFYDYFSAPGKLLYRVLLGLIVFGVLFMLLHRLAPQAFLYAYNPLVTSTEKEVVVEQIANNYRSMNLVATASYNFASYAATPVVLPNWHLWVSILLVTLAWSGLLAAGSRISGLWGFLVPAFFGVTLFTGQYAMMLFETDPRGMVTFGCLVPLMALFYLFQTNILKGNLVARWLAFFGLLFAYQTVILGLIGISGVHKMMFSGVFVQIALVGVAALMISKSFANGLTLLATNAKDPQKRWSPGKLILALSGLALLFTYNFLFYNAYVELPDIHLRPTYFLAIGALLTTITGQNAFHQLRDLFADNLAFTLLTGALALFALVTLGFHFGAMEYMLIYGVERMLSTVFFVMVIAQIGYLVVNFYPYLRRRQNVYYVLMAPPVYRFFAVWIVVLTVPFVLEAAAGWVIRLDLQTVRSNVEGDNMLLRGYPEFARSQYQKAQATGFGDPKSNFNVAQLTVQLGEAMKSTEQYNLTLEAYLNANKRVFFAPASVNYANFVFLRKNYFAAQTVLKRAIAAEPSTELYVALADAFRRNNQPDSAITVLKTAIDRNPNDALLYSNLAALYFAFDKPKAAKPLMRSAVDLNKNDPYVAQNELYYYLAFTDSVTEIRTQADTLPSLMGHNQNLVLMALRSGQDSLASRVSVMLEQYRPSNNISILRLLSLAASDSMQALQSKVEFIKTYNSQLAMPALHTLGVLYHKFGVPEMASAYFALAAQYDAPFEQFNVAQMQLDAGDFDTGYELLKQVAIEQEGAYKRDAEKELSILRFANGEEPVYLAWDFKGMTREQAMRMGIYAGKMGNLSRAVQSFKRVTEMAPKDPSPYVALAKITMQKDSLRDLRFAAEQLQSAVEKTGRNNDAKLLKAYVRLHLEQEDLPKAKAKLAELAAVANGTPTYHYLKGQIAEREYLPKDATESYQKALGINRFHIPSTVALYGVLMQAGEYLDAVDVMNAAIDLNAQRPDYWAKLGEAYMQLKMYEEAMGTFELARDLVMDEALKKAYDERFREAERKFAQ